MVVVDFGQMIRRAARRAVGVAFNLHASLLPALRGAAPVNWAIIRGHATTGVTTFRLVDSLDAGPIFVQRSTPISPEETAEELRDRLAALGAEAVAETLAMVAAAGRPVEQDHARATSAPKLTKADGRIDFSADAAQIVRRIHGTWPWPGGQARYVSPAGRNVEVIIARAAVAAGTAGETGECGAVCPDLTVSAGAGRVRIIQIKPAGGRLMEFRAFVNGYRVGVGARFVAAEP
jgi:methionyl-tRNA formyltransferase